MKKTAVVMMLALLLTFISSAEINPDAEAAILMEYETGRVLYEKNADRLLPIASTTKIMTCLLALENSSPDEAVTAGKNASGVTGSSIYLSEGETLSMSDMLYGLMLRSGNDCAVAIAEHISGSQAAFAEMMNERAAEIGAYAYFTTPNGLDEGGNGASARGIALIAREAMRNQGFREIVSTERKTIPWPGNRYSRVLTNKNKLLSDYEGALGIKTGYTSKAGRCLVFAAERDGMLLIGALIRCPEWFSQAKSLLDFGFDNYRMVSLPGEGEGGWTREKDGCQIQIGRGAEIRAPVRKNADYKVVLTEEKFDLPVQEGDAMGRALLYENGECVYECELFALNSVAKPGFLSACRQVIRAWPVTQAGLPCFYSKTS